MRCPHCNRDVTQVRDSRPAEGGGVVRRRRFCAGCQARFSTFERAHIPEMSVRKRDGSKVSFDRDKLSRSIRLALRKRPVAAEQVEQAIVSVLGRIEGMSRSVIDSVRIGEMAMEALEKLDTVAYVRFASVYKDFRGPEDFLDFIEKLRSQKDGVSP